MVELLALRAVAPRVAAQFADGLRPKCLFRPRCARTATRIFLTGGLKEVQPLLLMKNPLISCANSRPDKVLHPLAGLFGCLVLASPGFAAPFAYELNFNTSIYRVNAVNNNELFVGNAPFMSDSLAASPTASLYSADPNGVLWNITGAPFPVGPTGFTQIADLDWANNGLWGFSNPGSSLFFFDLGLNTVTYSTAITGLGGATITGVAYDATTGDIYLSGNTGLNTDQLLRIPFATTAAVTIGSMPISDALSYIADIDFDGASGNLYAMSFYHRDFYTVNTANGATTFVSTGPHRDTTAMALNPVPEPTTLTLLAAGALIFSRRKAR